MNRVILDGATRDKLRGVVEVELCDESGEKLGHFVSDELFRRLLYEWANAQVSDEELERRRRERGGRTLNEIWARLKNA
jgi:hypothetical protein